MGLFAKTVLGGTCQLCGTDGVSGGICRNCGYRYSAPPAKKQSFINDAKQTFISKHKEYNDKQIVTKTTTGNKQTLSEQHDLQHHNRSVAPQATRPATVTAVPATQTKVATVKTQAASSNTAAGKTKPKKGGLRGLFLLSWIGWMSVFPKLVESFSKNDGHVPELGTEGGIAVALTAFCVMIFSARGTVRTFIALVTLPMTTLFLIAKPYVAPVRYFSNNAWVAFAPTSETNSYFLLPGLILAFFTVVLYYGTLMRIVRWIRGS